MRKEYTIIKIEDIIPKDKKRRIVRVVVQLENIAEGATDAGLLDRMESTEMIMDLGYPAYGKDHYSASIDYLDKIKDGQLNHAVAKEVSAIIRKCWHDYPPPEDDEI